MQLNPPGQYFCMKLGTYLCWNNCYGWVIGLDFDSKRAGKLKMIWLDFFLRFLLENLIKPLSNHSSLEVSFTTKKILTLLLNCKKNCNTSNILMITWLYLTSIKIVLFRELKIIENILVLNYVWTVEAEHNQKKDISCRRALAEISLLPTSIIMGNFLNVALNSECCAQEVPHQTQ